MSRGLACLLAASISWFAVTAAVVFGLVESGTGIDSVFSLLTWMFAAAGLAMSGYLFVQVRLAARSGRLPQFATSVTAWIGTGMNGLVAAVCLARLPYSSHDGALWIALLAGMLGGAVVSAGLSVTGELLLTTRDARGWLHG